MKKNGVALTEFRQLVYRATKKIPRGRVSTYGNIARAIGRPGAGRAVGNALNKNPFAPRVPCHRVVRSNGAIGGFAGGAKRKTKLLKSEGVAVINGRIVEFKKIRFTFKQKK
jgi:methylated-DNA-[protein]-cysteine S-methyltransferase